MTPMGGTKKAAVMSETPKHTVTKAVSCWMVCFDDMGDTGFRWRGGSAAGGGAPPAADQEGMGLVEAGRVTAAGVVAAACVVAAAGFIGAGATAGGVLRIIFGILHVALVVSVHALHNLAVAVVAGDADGGFGQGALDVGRGREDDTARGDEAGGHLVHIVYGGGTYPEAHGAQTGDGYAVALGAPGPDDLSDGIPGRADGAAGNARTEGSLGDDLGLGEPVVQLCLKEVTILASILAYLQFPFHCFQFDTHSDTGF